MGSEMSGGVRNVVISNCVFSGTDRGIRLKSCRGRGGVIEDIRVDNIVMQGVLCPIVLNKFYNCSPASAAVSDPAAHPVDAGTPRFRRLRFSNITARDVRYAAAFLLGLPEMPIEDVVLDNCSIYLDAHATQGGSPAMAAGVGGECRAGVILKHARNVKLRRIDLHDQRGPAVSIQASSEVTVDELDARPDGACPLVFSDADLSEPAAGEASPRRRDFRRNLQLRRHVSNPPMPETAEA
jgi:hypothetical protein